jgi:hypothetical protein
VIVDLRNSLYALGLLAVTVPIFVLMKAARRSGPVVED